MTAIYIIAASPGGPVRIETATTLAAAGGRAPAYTEPAEGLDPELIAEAARKRLMMAATVAGWFGVGPQTGRTAVQQAKAILLEERAMAQPRPPQAIAPIVPASSAQIAEPVPMSRNERSLSHAPARETPVRVAQPVPPRRARRQTAAIPRARLRADVDVKGIRAGLRMTQAAFSNAFGMPLGTLRDWEQGKAAPDAAARTLLLVIEHRPDAVRQALAMV